MKLFVINGPTINMLGIREPYIYGKITYDSLIKSIKEWAKDLSIEIECYQSNVEGEIVNYIQQAYFDKADGIIINPAAYTHTSVAILDALKATELPTIEVHISDINNREEFRKKSFIKDYCVETIMGKGIEGYHEAMINLKKYLEGRK